MSTERIKFYQTGTFTAGNRLLDEATRTVQSWVDRTNSLNSGHRACQGCGEALGAHLARRIEITGFDVKRVLDAVTLYSKPEGHGPATFDHLNTWYYSDADASKPPLLNLVRRRSSFDEIVGGLDADNALLEARRCLSCGNCFNCDNGYAVCPDNAVIKLGSGKRYEFNYDYCKGCGLCAEECPCGAIDMVKEMK